MTTAEKDLLDVLWDMYTCDIINLKQLLEVFEE